MPIAHTDEEVWSCATLEVPAWCKMAESEHWRETLRRLGDDSDNEGVGSE